MGTRGFVSFVVDGQEKTAYNHWDSYPSGLGVSLLGWLHGWHDDGREREAIKALRVVNGREERPTPDDVARLSQFTDLHVGEQSTDDWYCLLRETQGNPALMLKAGVIEDAHEFPLDSLSAEYGYVIDLDRDVFEVYQGFQHKPHDKGRFAKRSDPDLAQREGVPEYYPVALLTSWPLSELPTLTSFEEVTERAQEEEVALLATEEEA